MPITSLLHRRGVVALQALAVIFALAASVLALAIPECRERTLHLTVDGIAVGVITSMIQILVMVGQRTSPLAANAALKIVRHCTAHHIMYGIAGGYLFGVTLAVWRCLCGA